MEIRCPYCLSSKNASDSRTLIVKTGRFLRRSDLTFQQRFRCRGCGRSFSQATFHPCYRQKKRQFNPEIFQYLASGISQRRLAITLRLNRKTVVRKFLFVAFWADHVWKEHRRRSKKSREIEFDDLETMEQTKLKPLSVTMAVESGSRRILGFRVARMSAKGRLAHRSVQKYGRRRDERRQKRRSLLREIAPFLTPDAKLKSDENPHYGTDVAEIFPGHPYLVFPGLRGCVTGQGELKATPCDPLFSLNHTCAMLRANINRLFRRTWNTTKRADRLALHLTLYCLYHNLLLIE